MTDDIRALLEELREIDIETWKDVRFHLINIFSVNDLGDINLRSPLLQNAYSDIIQGCIQRAIEATRSEDFLRDLFWEIEMIEKDEYEASIYDRENLLADVVAPSPAAAILAAYLAARKAMR